ncbi:MAG: hypothetical protein VB876_12570, partial [Pirellulales bacterium]
MTVRIEYSLSIICPPRTVFSRRRGQIAKNGRGQRLAAAGYRLFDHFCGLLWRGDAGRQLEDA